MTSKVVLVQGCWWSSVMFLHGKAGRGASKSRVWACARTGPPSHDDLNRHSKDAPCLTLRLTIALSDKYDQCVIKLCLQTHAFLGTHTRLPLLRPGARASFRRPGRAPLLDGLGARWLCHRDLRFARTSRGPGVTPQLSILLSLVAGVA